MKKKKHREMDLLVIFLCIVAFVGVVYIFFFAKTTHRPAGNSPAPAATEQQATPAPSPSAKTPPPVKKENNPLPAESAQRALPPAQLRMYNKKPFTTENEVYEFFPSEKIFLTLTFAELPVGTHTFTANWLTPAKQISSSANHTTNLDKPSAHEVRFWLELMKNGAFTEMLNGSEYRKSVYGTWKVDILMNSQLLQSKEFTIHE